MSIANELGKLIGELNQGVNVGTLQFLGGVPDTVSYGGGNFIKQFYDTQFIPHMNYFRKPINEKRAAPKPLLLRDRPRATNRKSVINNRVPVWREKELNKNGYVNWDSFLDERKVMSFDFSKPSPGNELTIKGTGIMILEDPFTNKEKIQRNNLRVIKQGVDLSSLLLGMLGVSPQTNPYLRRLTGFELAKAMKKAGLQVVQNGSWILLKFPDTVGGFLGNMIKKTVHEIKQVGKRIQKGLLDPVRETMKSKIPGVWKTIDKFDRNSGITKSLKKFSGVVEDVTKKYGEVVMRFAIMAAATIAGGPQNAAAASMLLTAADKMSAALSKKERKVLKEVVDVGGNLERIDKTDLKDLTVNLFSNIKNEMVKKKGTEGKNDFQKIINMARNTIEETKVSEQEVKKTVAGIGMTLMPLTQYNSFVLGCVLKGTN